MPEGDTGH